jgi:hypothetical protein
MPIVPQPLTFGLAAAGQGCWSRCSGDIAVFEVGEDQREAAQEASGALELPAITMGSATTGPSSSSAAVAAIGPQWNHTAAPGTRAVPGRRRRGGLKAWLQRLGDHPGEEQLAELTRSCAGLATPGAWSAPVVSR